MKLRLFIALTFLLLSGVTFAGLEKDPVLGQWMTRDKDTGNPTSIIELYLVGEELRGKIVKLYPEYSGIENPICSGCNGILKNKNILGMTFISGLKKIGDKWSGGKVIDLRNVPWQGMSVSCEIWREKEMVKIKAFFWFPVFGSEDSWERANDAKES